MRRHGRAAGDRVSEELVAYLLGRDGGCVAPVIDPLAGPCHDRWGNLVSRERRDTLTVEHVHEKYGKAGKRAKSDRWHTLLLCSGHGVQSWELRHKPEERDYLLRKEGATPA